MPDKPEVIFDKRTVARNIARGRMTRKEYDSYLAALPDLAATSEPLLGRDGQPITRRRR